MTETRELRVNKDKARNVSKVKTNLFYECMGSITLLYEDETSQQTLFVTNLDIYGYTVIGFISI